MCVVFFHATGARYWRPVRGSERVGGRGESIIYFAFDKKKVTGVRESNNQSDNDLETVGYHRRAAVITVHMDQVPHTLETRTARKCLGFPYNVYCPTAAGVADIMPTMSDVITCSVPLTPTTSGPRGAQSL